MTDTTAIQDTTATSNARRRTRGKGTLYKRPGSVFWWFAIGDRGRMIRESTNETDVKKARAKLKVKQDEIAAARGGYTTLPGPEVKTTTVQALLEGLLFKLRTVSSIKSITSHAAHVARAFGDWKVVELTGEAIARYVADRERAGHAATSINHSLQVLAQAIKPFLTKHRLLMPELHRIRHADRPREGFYSTADTEALIAALSDDLRDFTRWVFSPVGARAKSPR